MMSALASLPPLHSLSLSRSVSIATPRVSLFHRYLSHIEIFYFCEVRVRVRVRVRVGVRVRYSVGLGLGLGILKLR